MTTHCSEDDIVAVVPVRAGSKGLPNKNIMTLDGQPLYLHAVRQALRTVGRVLLSTDIVEIKEADLPKGCTLCPRPKHLAQDDTPISSVIDHLIVERALQGFTIVLLQATSPLRSDEDIQKAVALYREGFHDMVFGVAKRDRSILKYGTLENNTFAAVKDPALCFWNRQQLPHVVGPNGAMFVFGADEFCLRNGFPSERIGAIEMPTNRSIDIDTIDDLNYAEKYLETQHPRSKKE